VDSAARVVLKSRHSVMRDAKQPFDLVLLGAPGSGKGTQADALSRHFHLLHVATGDLFRDHLKRGTPLGNLAKTFMDRGELVPDNVTEAIVRERLGDREAFAGVVLDGFPRTATQARGLATIVAGLNRRL